MRIGLFKRLVRTDYSDEYQTLIDQLGVSLNNTVESLVNIVSKNVSLSDNIACTIKDIEVTVDANGTPKEAITINTDKSTITAVICGRANNLTNSNIYPNSGIQISYTQSGSKININNIAGLQANNIYSLRIVIFA